MKRWDWAGEVAPARTRLDADSAKALMCEPSARNRALRLATDLTEEELAGSAFVANALVLLEEAARQGWLWVTDRGCLQLATVAAMRASMHWPGMEATEVHRADKALREAYVGELHLLRRLLEMAGLVRRTPIWLELTPAGREMLEPGKRGRLQALLFRQALWHVDLSAFLRGVPRGVPGTWPQGEDVGVLLWCLSAVGGQWRGGGTLTALCTVAEDPIPEAHWNPPAWMFAERILGPLRWFGLMQCREPRGTGEVRRWRKTALFDRFLSFDVRLADRRGQANR